MPKEFTCPGILLIMERAHFESLVSRMEELAKANPGGYRRRVFGLAALGYHWFFGNQARGYRRRAAGDGDALAAGTTGGTERRALESRTSPRTVSAARRVASAAEHRANS